MMSKEMIYALIAHAAHEANRAFCQSIGDMSQAPWDKAEDWQKESAVVGVAGVIEKGNGPEQSHESWLAHKKADGWTFGEKKDPVAKTHPCFRPYAELPEEQKKKDAIFVGVVHTMASAFGLPIGPGVGNSAFSNG